MAMLRATVPGATSPRDSARSSPTAIATSRLRPMEARTTRRQEAFTMTGSYAVAAAARHRLRRRVAGQVGLRPLAVGVAASDVAHSLVVGARPGLVAAPVPSVRQPEQELGAGVVRQAIE